MGGRRNGKGKEKGKKNGGKGGILCSCDFFLGKAPANADRKPQLPHYFCTNNTPFATGNKRSAANDVKLLG